MKHKNLIVSGLIAGTLLGGSAWVVNASAHGQEGDSLASKIATKFNLNQDEVQNVIDENRQEYMSEHRDEMRDRLEERLNKAVADGKLTEEQKTKILNYLSEQEGFFESLVDKTHEERREALENKREEIKKWAEDNGIDLQYVMFGGHGGLHGPGMRGGHGR